MIIATKGLNGLGESKLDMFNSIYGTTVGGSIFSFFKTGREMDVAQSWGFAPPYMVNAQQSQTHDYSSTLVPVAIIAGAVLLAVMVMKR